MTKLTGMCCGISEESFLVSILILISLTVVPSTQWYSSLLCGQDPFAAWPGTLQFSDSFLLLFLANFAVTRKKFRFSVSTLSFPEGVTRTISCLEGSIIFSQVVVVVVFFFGVVLLTVGTVAAVNSFTISENVVHVFGFGETP